MNIATNEEKILAKEVQLLNPVALINGETVRMGLRHYENLKGATIGIVHSFVPYRGFEVLVEKLTAHLRDEYGVTIINYTSPGTHSRGPQDAAVHNQLYDTIAKEVDSVIVGTAF